MANPDPTNPLSTPLPATRPAPGSFLADPAPLGLAGFAMTTFFLSAVNAGLLNGVDGVLALALVYGVIVQLLAGMWEFARGNTFGAVAFSSYGAFWISYWYLVTHVLSSVPSGTSPSEINHAVGLYLLCWLIFTFYMFISTFKLNGALVVVFGTLVLAYLFLCIGAFGANTGMTKVGGWCGLVCAVSAWYTSFAAVTNSTFKRSVVPVFPLA
jgi:succinate-acetate transporter protein